LLPTLAQLAEAGHLPTETAATLEQSYRFLRRLENRMQMWADQQTHDMPEPPRQRQALVVAMDCDDWATLAATLAAVRRDVHGAFEQVFASPLAGAPNHDAREQRLLAFWDGDLGEDEGAALLAGYGIEDVAAIRAAIADLQD